MKNFSPILIRIVIAAVFIWFGLQQLGDPSSWFGFLPTWATTLPISQTDFIYLNGCFELLLGTSLLFGFYARTCALFLGLHLLGITYTVGYGAIGVRDFGLALTAISIAFGPISPFSIDAANAKEEPVTMPVTSYTPRPTTSFSPQTPIQPQPPIIEHTKVI
jgi:uncharacterized membrane protein YphA (DoxX/SURF4 family)